MQYFGFDRPSFAFKTYGFGSSEFSPLGLFVGGKQGVWYDPSDKSTLFQDAAGTIPVTKDGDPVALMKDKSGNGNHATQTVSTSRPIYKTDGILHWLQPDGVDDFFNSVGLVPYNGSKFFIATAMAITGGQRSLGPWRFLREGGSSQVATDNLLSEYSTSGAAPLRKSVRQDYPSLVIAYSADVRPTPNTNHVSWNSNSPTGFKSQVIPSQPSLVDAGIKSLTSGNATLSLFRGYEGDLMAGRFYGFIWLSDEITDEARDSANAYLANKAGVML